MGARENEIAPSARISADVTLIVGDCTSIGEDVVISGKGTLRIGDYVKVHRLTWINCHSDVSIGHNVWIGEKSILDGTAPLTIGNNVAIGTGSQVWTHISFGDTFSGCRLRTSHGVTLADEAWLAGPVIIQAASLAPRVVVLAGSNVVHDIDEPNTIWTGNPPVNVTGAMGGPPWTTITVEQKLKRFNRLLRAYETETGERFSDRFSCVVRLPPKVERRPGVTYFEADNRIYTKLGTDAERRFMRWLLKLNKAKFTPEP